MPNKIIVVEGAQWGSEAKGNIAAYLCKTRNVDYAVRTGAVNAGHTVMVNNTPWKMQQLPTGFIHPNTKLVIGPGALVHPGILQREIEELEMFVDPKIKERIFIDFRAGLHTEQHTTKSAQSDRHHLIGATGKGCSEALVDRVRLRGAGGRLFRDCDYAKGLDLCDTVDMLNTEYDRGAKILLEGTQGSLLDLYMGPYPYTTHKSTQAATWIQEAGLSPALDFEIVLVARTYPIRVAGNSGPMPGEISWTDLAAHINAQLVVQGLKPLVKGDSLLQWEDACKEVAQEGRYWLPRTAAGNLCDWHIHNFDDVTREKARIACSELHRDAWQKLPGPVQADLSNLFEFTTVTKKLRRIAKLDLDLLRLSCQWNRPDWIALTFADYVQPELRNLDAWDCDVPALMSDAKASLGVMMDSIEDATNVGVSLFSTGPRVQHCVNIIEVANGVEPKSAPASQ